MLTTLCGRDTVITCLVNTATCLLAGVVTFSILGHMAHNQVRQVLIIDFNDGKNVNKFCLKESIFSNNCLWINKRYYHLHLQGVPVKEVVNSGPGLVFITYPEVVLKLPGGSIWAIIFFFMLVVSATFLVT